MCSVHVVFGHVLSGQDIVKKIESLPTDARSRPSTIVAISNCGELVLQYKRKGVSTSLTLDQHCLVPSTALIAERQFYF